MIMISYILPMLIVSPIRNTSTDRLFRSFPGSLFSLNLSIIFAGPVRFAQGCLAMQPRCREPQEPGWDPSCRVSQVS
jgi:hypothetical protein